MGVKLDIKDLSVSFRSGKRTVYAVNGLSFHVEPGETLGLIGESGCGKTVTCRALLGLNSDASTRGDILLDGKSLQTSNEREMRAVRGKTIAMVFQNPMSALNPIVPIGRQITEVIRHHRGLDAQHAQLEAIASLRALQIPDPELKMNDYPHQLSGGMNQRIAIAIALACRPHVLIADEPTASLDVTVQEQIMSIFRELKKNSSLSLIFVSHDLALVSEVADRTLIIYHGMLMEEGPTARIFQKPRHPYTEALVSAIPMRGGEKIVLKGEPISPYIQTSGCPFAPRCQRHIGSICDHQIPPVYESPHSVRCHLYGQRSAKKGVY